MAKTRGNRRGSTFTFRRRMMLVRLLLRGPFSAADLIAEASAALDGDETYPEAAAIALKHDLDALKSEYGCEIVFNRSTRRYELRELGELALLDLTNPSLEALAFLDANFPAGSSLPEHTSIRTLIDQLHWLLPAERRSTVQGGRMTLAVHPNTDRIDTQTFAQIKRAVHEQREVQFAYRSNYDEGEARLHRVAPYDILFRPEGHVYLDATVLEVQPAGAEQRHAAIHYRLDRIVGGSVQVLPRKLPLARPKSATYRIRYTLLPIVARQRDISVFFPESVITYHDDGRASISATVTNLWQTRQILLRYGSACIVEQPAELVALFARAARELADIYRDDTGDAG